MSLNSFYEDADAPGYRPFKDIEQHELVNGLCRLTFFRDDPFLRMQAHNLSLIDQFLMDIEYKVLAELIEKEKTPLEAMFLSAQSQMWIFAAYELMRTWRQRAKAIEKWFDCGGLEQKLEQYEKKIGYNQKGRLARAQEIRQVLSDKSKAEDIKNNIRLIHIVFSRLEAIRVYMAKHEIAGKSKSVAFMPGYGRINKECGALDYQLENEAYIIGYINRRDIADEIRALKDAIPPSIDDINEFDLYMRGFNSDELEDLFDKQ